MFSGLVEGLALVANVVVLDGGVRLGLALNRGFDLRLGDSLCCSGVCLTVVGVWLYYVELEAWRVSLVLSSLSRCLRLDVVNVEPSLRLSALLHGHLTSGHTASVVKLTAARALGACLLLELACPAWLVVVLKPLASVCLDGVSLTISSVNGLCFSVHLIRHTVARTTYSSFCWNKEFNLE